MPRSKLGKYLTGLEPPWRGLPPIGRPRDASIAAAWRATEPPSSSRSAGDVIQYAPSVAARHRHGPTCTNIPGPRPDSGHGIRDGGRLPAEQRRTAGQYPPANYSQGNAAPQAPYDAVTPMTTRYFDANVMPAGATGVAPAGPAAAPPYDVDQRDRPVRRLAMRGRARPGR